MAKTRTEGDSREIAKLRKEIGDLTKTLASIKKSAGSAYLLRITTDDNKEGEYRILRIYYHLRKDAVHDMSVYLAKMCGPDAKPSVATTSRMEYRRTSELNHDEVEFEFSATIKKITIN